MFPACSVKAQALSRCGDTLDCGAESGKWRPREPSPERGTVNATDPPRLPFVPQGDNPRVCILYGGVLDAPFYGQAPFPCHRTLKAAFECVPEQAIQHYSQTCPQCETPWMLTRRRAVVVFSELIAEGPVAEGQQVAPVDSLDALYHLDTERRMRLGELPVPTEEKAGPPTKPWRWRIGHRVRRRTDDARGIVLLIRGLLASPTSLQVRFDDGKLEHVHPDELEFEPVRGEPRRQRRR
jgi:hypothetical protein